MTSRLLSPRRASVLLVLAGSFGVAAPAVASPSTTVLVVDGSHVTKKVEPGVALADLERTAPNSGARSSVTASAARATSSTGKAAAKKKTKKAKPVYDLAVIRKAIKASGGAADRTYAARAALTTADAVMRAAGSSSQAHRELENLLKITTVMARSNRITADRLPMLTETLNRNAQWWKLGRATGASQRVTFDGDQLVWQYYPGSGMQIQWLGTFGQGNFLYGSGSKSVPALQGLLDEATKLAVPRAGGIAWEYFFPFDGGNPPWVSGMAEATGIQVFARAGSKLARPDYLATAKSAMGILKTPPPVGVEVVQPTGTHFLQYSFAPKYYILNADNQAVNGLYAYVLAAPDDVDARLMLLGGLRWLDANIKRYDTGSWSLYSLDGDKANAHYHELEAEFARTLCSLLNADAKTPGGGPTGAYPSANICAEAANFTKYAKS